MRFELEDEKYDIYQRKDLCLSEDALVMLDIHVYTDHTCATTNLQRLHVGKASIVERSMKCGLRFVSIFISLRALTRIVLTGSTRLITLRLRRQALICVTVLL